MTGALIRRPSQRIKMNQSYIHFTYIPDVSVTTSRNDRRVVAMSCFRRRATFLGMLRNAPCSEVSVLKRTEIAGFIEPHFQKIVFDGSILRADNSHCLHTWRCLRHHGVSSGYIKKTQLMYHGAKTSQRQPEGLLTASVSV